MSSQSSRNRVSQGSQRSKVSSAPSRLRKSATGGNKDAEQTPSIKDLTIKVKQLEEELLKEKEQRNYYQLERDKINSFWEITKNELNTVNAELRNKDREMEEMEERHQVEIKVYKQKVKHLHYEHQNNLGQLKTQAETDIKLQIDQYRNKEMQLKKLNRATKADMKEVDIGHEDVIKNLKLEHDKSITKLRQEFEKTAKELHTKYERKMKQLRTDLELRRKNEVHEVEERKNAHINELITKHDQYFAEIKSYYNDITQNNVDMIKSLKEQLEEMKKKEQADSKLMTEIQLENKRLTEPLQKTMKEVEQLRHELANYSKDKESLQHSKARVKHLETELKNLKWEHEVLEQRFTKVQKERDELYDKFVSSIYEVQKKSGMKNLLLEKKLENIQSELEVKETQLNKVIVAANLDPASARQVTQRVDDLLNDKNTKIKDLEYEVARLKKGHNELVRVYEAKFKQFGIPTEELGFTPQMMPEAPPTSTPANLVAS